MKVKKGQLLKINHARKGSFVAVALRDFSSEEESWLPIAIAEGYVKGLTEGWVEGDEIPCRASLVRSIEPVEIEEEGQYKELTACDQIT